MHLPLFRYENISNLIEKLERTFEAQGYKSLFSTRCQVIYVAIRYFWISDNVLLSQQKGVFRVNCIDCLDRTNVVQVSFFFFFFFLISRKLIQIFDSLRSRDTFYRNNWALLPFFTCQMPEGLR